MTIKYPLLLTTFFIVSIIHCKSQWSAYGGDAGGTRYSNLTQISIRNVQRLKPAWEFHTGEADLFKGTDALSKAAFEATPILIGRTLYFSTPSCRVFAIDAASGRQKWVYDPGVNLLRNHSEITSRGVSAWTGKKNEVRIFAGTIDGRLIALNAADGKPVAGFGSNGTIDLRQGYGDDISITSPPAILGNLVITGCSLGDNQRTAYPKGMIRAFDVITGAQVWQWDPLAMEPSGKTGAANAWSVLSVDEKRNLVFVPTTSPSPDYYGGNRKGANLDANSVVALQGTTGKFVWGFQVVHHDLWDYDIAAQPVLVDIRRHDSILPAVVVGTKMGHIFILDRLTGKPLFPVEERAVPASSLAGESAFPTQPFPVLPEPVGIQRISVNEAWGPTEEAKKIAAERIARYTNEGPFTPPSEKGTLVTPGNVGGIHWGGMCYDPVKGMLYTNINQLAAIIRMIPRDQLNSVMASDQELMRKETGWQEGSPYVLKRDYLFSVQDGDFVMQSKPPWGTLLSIDLASGAKKWEVPLGFMMDTVKYPESKKWGSLNFGGAIVTAGQLIFVAATRDNYFRAFDSGTGKLLWEYLLPASAQATPMTYSIRGKQYVVIAAGGHGKFLTKQGDSVVAFALE